MFILDIGGLFIVWSDWRILLSFVRRLCLEKSRYEYLGYPTVRTDCRKGMRTTGFFAAFTEEISVSSRWVDGKE